MAQSLALALTVNGRRHRLIVRPEQTLLDLLRGELRLTGAKEACGIGDCGACTVLVDGKPAYACLLLAIDVGDRTITTIEGLAGADGALHPVQQAFIDADALQCGFCTPGQILSATALLRSRPHPTDAEIKHALAGNLCRCGAYQNIISAVHRAAEQLATEER
jgi:aerobic-type carbon monoxide dehydrogenase small subunit (CoxS/CutS family)